MEEEVIVEGLSKKNNDLITDGTRQNRYSLPPIGLLLEQLQQHVLKKLLQITLWEACLK